MAAALDEPVRRDREGEPAERRGDGGQLELAEPEEGEEARRDDRPEQEQVPGDDRPGESFERPEREPVGPAAEHRLGLDERLERVRVAPRRASRFELVADEPEAIGRLEMVAGGGLPVPGQAGGKERRPEVEDGRERGDERRDDIEGGDEEERPDAHPG